MLELLRNFEVVSIAEGFVVTAADGRTVECEYLLNCAGGFSDQVAKMVGDDFFTIIPRAGEYMLLDKSEGSRVKHTIFQVPSKEGKGILVTPTVDGNLLTGPTAVKVETPESTQTTPDGLAMISRLAAKSVPSVNFCQVITSFSGVRSSAHGDDFIIQPSAAAPKCVHTGAIDSLGLTSCVAIAKYAVELLEKQGLALNAKADWNGHRKNTRAFREMSDAEKDAFIKENPDYGKIVCRCETVSEGEIRAAIRRNPIEETKRYVPCDTLLLSVGLIPENELTRAAGIPMDPITSGAVVDENCQTKVPGIFACGNVLQVHDLVDYVSDEAERAGRGAANFVKNGQQEADYIPTKPGFGVRYVLPQQVNQNAGADVSLFLRVTQPFNKVKFTVKAGDLVLATAKRLKAAPGEMEKLTIKKELLGEIAGEITVSLEEV